MFTGIIERVVQSRVHGNKLTIPKVFEVDLGDSVSVNGVCLTVSELSQTSIGFDLGEETVRVSNLRFQRMVNLERALVVGRRMNGHIVTGHVDGMIRVIRIARQKDTWWFTFTMPRERWGIARKGSVALNGISLTVADVSLDSFTVQVIPYTYENANLKDLKVGDLVNYEIDILARYAKGESK